MSSIFCCCQFKSRDIHKLTGHVSDDDDEASLLEDSDYDLYKQEKSMEYIPVEHSREYKAPILYHQNSSMEKNSETMSLEDKQCKILRRALRKQGYILNDQLTDPNMIRRYYRAKRGDMDKTLISIKSTIKWREESFINAFPHIFSQNNLLWNIEMQAFIRFENSTGKCYVRGYDRDGRATIVMHPRNENSPSGEDSFKHMLYNIERAIACTRRRTNGAVDTFNFIVDFKDYQSKQSPSFSRTKESISIAQNHYPERLHRAYLIDTTGFMNLLWNLAKPFIDPKTRAKIEFIPRKNVYSVLSKYYDRKELESCFGGCANRDFHSEEYLTGPFYTAFGEMDINGSSSKRTETRLDDDYFYDAFSRHSVDKNSIDRLEVL